MPFNVEIILNPFRLKACYHQPKHLEDLKEEEHFKFELVALGGINENGEKFWHEDFSVRQLLSKMLLNKEFSCLNNHDERMITAVVFESFCLIKLYWNIDWEFHYKVLDKQEQDGINNPALIDMEIEDVEELVKLLSIQENFANSEMSIKHRDERGNIISKDNITVNKESYRIFLDQYIADKYKSFKRDNAFGHFGRKELSKTRKTDLISSNSILSVKMNRGLAPECTLNYFRELLEQMSVYKIQKNKSARRIFTSLIVKSLKQYLEMLIEEAKPKIAPLAKDKHLYIFYAIRFFNMIPFDRPNLFAPSGNHSEKEDYIKDLLKM